MKYPLRDVIRELSIYDPSDLIAVLASLQLLPQNGDNSIRLEAFAYASATLLGSNKKRNVNINKLNKLLNNSQFSQQLIMRWKIH